MRPSICDAAFEIRSSSLIIERGTINSDSALDLFRVGGRSESAGVWFYYDLIIDIGYWIRLG